MQLIDGKPENEANFKRNSPVSQETVLFPFKLGLANRPIDGKFLCFLTVQGFETLLKTEIKRKLARDQQHGCLMVFGISLYASKLIRFSLWHPRRSFAHYVPLHVGFLQENFEHFSPLSLIWKRNSWCLWVFIS